MCETIRVSPLPKTWILDLDGTLVRHNGHKLDGHDTLLPGAERLLGAIRPEDLVLIVTSRTEEYRDMTEAFLRDNAIRYDHIIYNAPYGERILINDKKPSGLKTAIAVNPERDMAAKVEFQTDESL